MRLPALPSPGWPADDRRDAAWRRAGLPFFILLSLVVHGLGLQLKFQFWPKFPVDRENRPFRAELKAAQVNPSPQAAPASLAAPAKARPGGHFMAPVPASAAPPAAFTLRQPPASDLVERAKAELRAASQRQMLDPMFAPVARPATRASPLERTIAVGEQKIEQRGADLFRVTNPDGSQYCLQRPSEVATRDIPVPVISVPMKCQ